MVYGINQKWESLFWMGDFKMQKIRCVTNDVTQLSQN